MDPGQELLVLLRNISEAKFPEMMLLLLQVKDVVESSEKTTKRSPDLKRATLQAGLLPIIILSLKQNFGKFEDGWKSSPGLARFLADLCVNADPNELQNFKTEILPDALESILYLASRFQKKLNQSITEENRKQFLLDSFVDVIGSVGIMLAGFQELAKIALESMWFLQMLLSDDEQTTPKIMSLIQTVNKTRIGIFDCISVEASRHIMDELVYKILTTNNSNIVSSSARTIIEICKSSPTQIKPLTTKYHGLRAYAEKWKDETFVGDLLILLDTGSLERARLKKFEKQVIQIQAWWRGHLLRKRLREASRSLSHFQQSFRERKDLEERGRQQRRMDDDLQYMLAVQRKYNMRKLHRRQLHAIQILPSSQVAKYLIQEQHDAAIRIQSSWRRFTAQRQVPAYRQKYIQKQAAIKIQRAYRKYSSMREREDEPIHLTLRLSEERRNELREKIAEWTEGGKQSQTRSMEESEQFHEMVQASLSSHLVGRQRSIGQHQHLEALVVHVSKDAHLLISALEGLETDQPLRSCSVPVSTKAREEHLESLRQLNLPWWKRLDIEAETPTDFERNDWRIF